MLLNLGSQRGEWRGAESDPAIFSGRLWRHDLLASEAQSRRDHGRRNSTSLAEGGGYALSLSAGGGMRKCEEGSAAGMPEIGPDTREATSDWIKWLSDAACNLRYGEVGVTLVLVEGQIVRVKKILEESSMLGRKPRKRAQE